MILIGGIGTLSGALVGAATFKLLSFFLEHRFPGASQLLIGGVYIAIVLLLPYGIVGTWRLRSFGIRQAWQRRVKAFNKQLDEFLKRRGDPGE